MQTSANIAAVDKFKRNNAKGNEANKFLSTRIVPLAAIIAHMIEARI